MSKKDTNQAESESSVAILDQEQVQETPQVEEKVEVAGVDSGKLEELELAVMELSEIVHELVGRVDQAERNLLDIAVSAVRNGGTANQTSTSSGKGRFGADKTPKPVTDAVTGLTYASKNQAGISVGVPLGYTKNSKIWYAVDKAFPGRFIEASTGLPTNPVAQTNEQVNEQANTQSEGSDS